MKNFQRKVESATKYAAICLYIFGVPIFLYLFAKWDPFVGFDEAGDPILLGAWPIILVYWILIFLVYKYNDERKRYKESLEKLLLLDCPISAEERSAIYRRVLEVPRWEIGDDGRRKTSI